MEYARTNGLPYCHLSLASCGGDALRFERELLEVIRSNGIDLVALAGYMKKLPDSFVHRYEHKILNVHPALLPSFGGSAMYGMRVHEAVIERGCKVSGATVHFVTSEYDAGPIVLQKCCAVLDSDTPQTLSQRVREVEFQIYPKAIELVAQDKVTVQNNRVFIHS